MENAGYLFAAFSVIWAMFFAYVFLSLYRQKRLRRDIDSLKKSLKDKGVER